MAADCDYSTLAAEEQGFLKQVLSVFPNDGASRTIIRGICAVFISKLQDSEKAYELRASDLNNQIESLRALIGTEAGRSSTELSSLLMLLIQLRRLARDHLLQVKAEISEALEQARADLKGLESQPVDSSSLAMLGDGILCKAPIANCMARSAAFDAVTAITAYVSHCVVLAFALHKFSVATKERSLKLLAQDDQDSATLVLIERQNVLTTIKTLVEHSSVLTKAADWFAREAEKDLLLLFVRTTSGHHTQSARLPTLRLIVRKAGGLKIAARSSPHVLILIVLFMTQTKMRTGRLQSCLLLQSQIAAMRHSSRRSVD